MKPVSAFFSRVIPYVIGCPEPLAQQAIVDSAIQFCDDSMVLRETLDSQTTINGQSTYELDAPSQQQITRILGVWADGVQLKSAAQETAVSMAHVSTDLLSTGWPAHFYTTRTGSELLLNLWPTPNTPISLDVEVVTRPVRDATDLENDLYDFWMNAIVAGALGRLMAIPNQPFTNIELSMTYLAKASREASKARVDGNIGRVVSTQYITPRPFV